MEFRVDFRFVDISNDPTQPEIVAVLDPERYEYGRLRDEEGWFDRFDHLFFSHAQLMELLKKAAKLPLGTETQLVSDSSTYVQKRRPEIERAFEEGLDLGAFCDAKDEDLRDREGDEDRFVILFIDLVGSTELSHKLETSDFARLTKIYTNEVVTAGRLFHGVLLKPMGDGVLLYFPSPSFIRKNDFAVDLALLLRDLVLEGINPALESRGLPHLGCRIGIDSGEAVVQAIGGAGISNHMDLIGRTVSLATKIEALAPVNGILVGETVVRNVHTMWRRHLKEIALPASWNFHDRRTGQPYRVSALDIA